MSVLMNFAMFPTDKGASVSPYVAKVVEVVMAKGFVAELTAMGTMVETSTFTEALNVLGDAYKALEPDCDRVYVSVNFDVRKGNIGRIESKVQSVKDKLR